MIATLKGVVSHIRTNSLVIDVNGVGYLVYTLPDTLSSASEGKDVSLYTYLSVREQALDLYGFIKYEELEFFELLIGVSGIGPRSALAILNLTTVETLKNAISKGESVYLTKVSGIGKKSAEKIILELRDKLEKISHENGAYISGDVDTLEALKTLGYSLKEAREALKQVSADIENPNDRIKAALKKLG